MLSRRMNVSIDNSTPTQTIEELQLGADFAVQSGVLLHLAIEENYNSNQLLPHSGALLYYRRVSIKMISVLRSLLISFKALMTRNASITFNFTVWWNPLKHKTITPAAALGFLPSVAKIDANAPRNCLRSFNNYISFGVKTRQSSKFCLIQILIGSCI